MKGLSKLGVTFIFLTMLTFFAPEFFTSAKIGLQIVLLIGIFLFNFGD